jgi:hypothetical protein
MLKATLVFMLRQQEGEVGPLRAMYNISSMDPAETEELEEWFENHTYFSKKLQMEIKGFPEYELGISPTEMFADWIGSEGDVTRIETEDENGDVRVSYSIASTEMFLLRKEAVRAETAAVMHGRPRSTGTVRRLSKAAREAGKKLSDSNNDVFTGEADENDNQFPDETPEETVIRVVAEKAEADRIAAELETEDARIEP